MIMFSTKFHGDTMEDIRKVALWDAQVGHPHPLSLIQLQEKKTWESKIQQIRGLASLGSKDISIVIALSVVDKLYNHHFANCNLKLCAFVHFFQVSDSILQPVARDFRVIEKTGQPENVLQVWNTSERHSLQLRVLEEVMSDETTV